MTLPIRRDIVEEGLDNLPYQFNKSPLLRKYLTVHLEEIQKVYDSLFQLLEERGVRRAVGEQLEVLGRIVGEKRYGRSDESYRVAIMNRAISNRSQGTPEEHLAFLKRLTGSEVIKLWEHYGSSVMMYAESGVNTFTAHAMQDASLAGVQLQVMFDNYGDSFVSSEVSITGIRLIDNNLDGFVVVDTLGTEYDFVVSDGSLESGGDHSFLPELYERIEETQSIVNPALDTDSDWTKGTGWTIASNLATKAAGVASDFSQSQVLVAGTQYVVSFTIQDRTAGSVTPAFTGGSPTTEDPISTNGTYTGVITALAGNNLFAIEADDTFDGSIKNISIFELNETPVNPLCELLDSSVRILEITKIIDDSGNFLVDESDNNIIAV